MILIYIFCTALFCSEKMNYGNIANVLRELDGLSEQTNVPEYKQSINGLIKQINTLKNLEGNPLIIFDNRHDEKLDNRVETYIGKLGDEFILPTGSIVSDERVPRIKIQFQPETLNRFYYINRGYAITFKAVPEDIGFVYPRSEILSKKDDVKKKLESEHYEPLDSTIEEFLESLGKK